MAWIWITLLLLVGIGVAWNLILLRRMSGAEGSSAADLARKQLRRAWVLIAGTSLILLGILISPLPGPGFTLLGPMGLALMATEFVWARKLLAMVKERTKGVQDRADQLATNVSRSLAVLVMLGYWLAIACIAVYDPVPQWLIWPLGSLFFAPILLWGVKVFKRAKVAQAVAAERRSLARQARIISHQPAESRASTESPR